MKHLRIILLSLFCGTVLYSHGFSTTVENVDNKYTIENQLKEFFESKLKVFVASFVQQSSNDKTKCRGTIYILRDNKKPQMRVAYENGPIQDIIMEGKKISIINRKTRKIKTYSILTTPLYALLSGKTKLSDFKYNIIVNTNDITVNINTDQNNIILLFSTKKSNVGPILDKLLAWTIDDGKTIINVGFNTNKYYINDRSKLPDGIFTIKIVPKS